MIENGKVKDSYDCPFLFRYESPVKNYWAISYLSFPMKNPGKQRFSFDFEHTIYTGYIISSTDIEPHFHWFMFDDPGVIAQYGDSIAFKVENGELVALYHMTAPLFVKAVEECVRQHLVRTEGTVNPQ